MTQPVRVGSEIFARGQCAVRRLRGPMKLWFLKTGTKPCREHHHGVRTRKPTDGRFVVDFLRLLMTFPKRRYLVICLEYPFQTYVVVDQWADYSANCCYQYCWPQKLITRVKLGSWEWGEAWFHSDRPRSWLQAPLTRRFRCPQWWDCRVNSFFVKCITVLIGDTCPRWVYHGFNQDFEEPT